MVTRVELHDYLGRRPFQPFKVYLKSGEIIDIFRRSQACANDRWFMTGIGPRCDRGKVLRLDEIDHVELDDPKRYQVPEGDSEWSVP
jgi:hypothetical protein